MNTNVISEKIIAVLHKAQNALSLRDDEYIQKNKEILQANLDQIAAAFSGSFLGYHASIYYRGFETPLPGDHFSSEWGFGGVFGPATSSNWVEYTTEAVTDAAKTNVSEDYETRLIALSEHAMTIYEEGHNTILTILDILLDKEKSSTLDRIKTEIENRKKQMPRDKLINAMLPKGSLMSRDMTAISQGVRVPPHIALMAQEMSLYSPFTSIELLIKSCKSLLGYMEIHDMIDKTSTTKAERIFIGHGRSLVWRELKDFIQDRLHLSWEEFNREPTAGQATTERLQAMVDNSCFAFLVMTAEDEHKDTTLHARENVIHEAGLFQGRLGFRKAIILLEDGCKEFSNITGLGQLQFPKGQISAVFEEVRRVLEREKII